MANDCILVLGANQFQRERALIGVEKATDAAIITVASNAPFHGNKFAGNVLCSVETDPGILLQDVEHFLSTTEMNLIGVIPLNDFVLNAGYLIAQKYNLPYNSVETIDNCRSKDKLKKVLAKAGLPIIESYKVSSIEEAISIAQSIGYPVVIKPVNFGGSGGVKKITNEEELIIGFKETMEHLSMFAKKYDADYEHILLEPYFLRDREISVEILNTPSEKYLVGITNKFLSEEPYFSEVGHQVPSDLMFDNDAKELLFSLAKKACLELKINFGLAHVEIKINSNLTKPVIIEVGARPAGDGILDLYEKATRYNFYKAHCETYLGNFNANEFPKGFCSSAALAYFHPEEGFIESINEDLPRDILKGVDIIKINVQPGQEIKRAQNWSTRYGYVEFTQLNDLSSTFDLISRCKDLTNCIFRINNKNEIF